MAKSIMVQGTASSVGKSVISAGLCRVFKNRGLAVAPFKSQNMALNSFITRQGHEMGRAQVVQAEAAGLQADVTMNPILLKPSTDKNAQVIIEGVVHANMSAQAYHKFKPQIRDIVSKNYNELAARYDYIVIEGAGSPAEINLREGDLVNMGMAEISDSPVIIVGDIDRGGVFAALYGTVMLLDEAERRRIKGFIINKFRGDVEILKPGLTMIESLTGIPVLGVLPYSDIKLEDEDSLAERFKRDKKASGQLTLSVIYLPHVSNFTDFNAFEMYDDVNLHYVMRGETIPPSDVIFIPGSKNTIEDMLYLNRSGLAADIIRHQRQGGRVVGICGGYQMLGRTISDPTGSESSLPQINGLSLLDVKTVIEPIKTTTQVAGSLTATNGEMSALAGTPIEGYEIHMGQTKRGERVDALLQINERLAEPVHISDGAISQDGRVFGTYLHGIFDNAAFRDGYVEQLRRARGLSSRVASTMDFDAFKETEYNKLASLLEEHLDIDSLINILEDW